MERWRAFAIVLVAYLVAFLGIALSPFDHHDSFQTLARVGCLDLNWFDFQTGRPLFAFAQCFATWAGDGIPITIVFRAVACGMLALTAGGFAAALTPALGVIRAAAIALAMFALPGAVLTFMMLQSSLLAPTVPLAVGAGALLAWRLSGWTILAACTLMVIVLFWYQSNVVLFFVPIIAALFLRDHEEDNGKLVALAGAVFIGPCLVAYLSQPLLASMGPVTSPFGGRAVAFSIAEFPGRLVWNLADEIGEVPKFWFSRDPIPGRTIVFLVILGAAIVTRALRAQRPTLFAVTVIAALGLANLVALIAPPTVYQYERVRWPVQAAVLIPILIEGARLVKRPRLTVAISVALVAITIIPVQRFVIDGRLLFDGIELAYARKQVAMQIAEGRDASVVVSVAAGKPAGAPHQDELFYPTSNALGSLPGMIYLIYREQKLSMPKVVFLGPDVAEDEVKDKVAQAQAARQIVVDFRRMPVAATR